METAADTSVIQDIDMETAADTSVIQDIDIETASDYSSEIASVEQFEFWDLKPSGMRQTYMLCRLLQRRLSLPVSQLQIDLFVCTYAYSDSE